MDGGRTLTRVGMVTKTHRGSWYTVSLEPGVSLTPGRLHYAGAPLRSFFLAEVDVKTGRNGETKLFVPYKLEVGDAICRVG